MVKKALYWEKEKDKIRCKLCPKNCLILEGKRGFCRVRESKEGVLWTKIYAECSSPALDPIEKKPLYHFYPGTDIFSIGTIGCNLGCKFCQNWHISQVDAATEELMPEDAVNLAKKYNSIGIAYTYNEPIIWYEYVLDTAKLVKDAGLKNVLVTNGFINEEPLKEILPLIDAMNIDLKSIKKEFYKDICYGDLEQIKNTIKISAKVIHVEITNLIIPGLNDTSDEIRELVNFISEVDNEIPLHFSAYFPNYKMNVPPTPEETLRKAKKIASEKLKYVYVGNVNWKDGSNTICPNCNKVIIERIGYSITKNNIEKGNCKFCLTKIKGVFLLKNNSK